MRPLDSMTGNAVGLRKGQWSLENRIAEASAMQVTETTGIYLIKGMVEPKAKLPIEPSRTEVLLPQPPYSTGGSPSEQAVTSPSCPATRQ